MRSCACGAPLFGQEATCGPECTALLPADRLCANPFCKRGQVCVDLPGGVITACYAAPAKVTGRKLCCSPECDKARRKARDVSRPEPTQAVRVEPERVLQRQAEALLRSLAKAGEILCWYHVPSRLGQVPHREERGFPDLVIGIRESVVAAIECKQAGKGLEENQTAWESAFWPREHGGHYALCRTLDEVREALRGWGVRC